MEQLLIKFILVAGLIVTYVVRWRPGTANRVIRQKGIHKPLLVDVVIAAILLPQLFGITENSLGAPSDIRYFGIAVFILGTFLAAAARLALKKDYMPAFNTAPSAQIISTGPYRIVRHPIYLGTFLMVLGFELSLNSWVVLIVFAFIFIGINRIAKEESLLTMTHEKEWRNFIQKTKYKVVPFIY